MPPVGPAPAEGGRPTFGPSNFVRKTRDKYHSDSSLSVPGKRVDGNVNRLISVGRNSSHEPTSRKATAPPGGAYSHGATPTFSPYHGSTSLMASRCITSEDDEDDLISTRAPSLASVEPLCPNISTRKSSHKSVKQLLLGVFGDRCASNESTFSDIRNRTPRSNIVPVDISHRTPRSNIIPDLTPECSQPCSPTVYQYRPCKRTSLEEGNLLALQNLKAAAERWNYQLITTYNCSFLPSIRDYNEADPFWDFRKRSIKAIIILANLTNVDQVESAKKLLMLFSRNPHILPFVVCVCEAGTASLEETLGREKILAITTSLIKAGAGDVILKCDQDTPMAIEVAVIRTEMLWMEAESEALAKVREIQEDLRFECREKVRSSRDSSDQQEKICIWKQASKDVCVDLPSVDPELHEDIQSDLSVKVGDFHMVKALGSGSFGQVFFATTKGQCQLYAVKVVDKKKCTSRKCCAKVLREVKYLGQLPVHAHIATLHRVLHSGSALYLCVDYGGPSNLYHCQLRAPGQKLNISLVQEIFGQVADAVQHLHNNHVCHRDLKPENIAMNGSKALLVDFGLAADTQEVHALCCGSLPFAAPEVMTKPCLYHGAQVDAWSLGVLLFEMVRGVHSFSEMMGWLNVADPSPLLTEQLRLHFSNGIPWASMRTLHPDISDVMIGLLRFDASSRWTLKDVCESPWVACRVPFEQSSPKMSGC